MSASRARLACALSALLGLCVMGGVAGRDAAAQSLDRSQALQLRASKLGEGPELSSRDRLRRLEGEVAALREQATRRGAELDDLRGMLDQSGEHRRQQDFWLVLAALASAVVAGAVGWRMAPQRREPPRRRRRAMSSDSEDEDGRIAPSPVPGPRKTGVEHRSAEPAAAELVPADPEPLAEWPASGPALLHTHQPTNDVLLEGEFRTEALLATLQQVDFFVSLGDPQAAIGVLTTYLDNNTAAPPLAWLELLGLYHSQDQNEFERLSERFLAATGLRVPSWGAPEWHASAQAGLEAFAQARSEVVSVWQTEVAPEVLEGLLFHMPASRAGLLSPLAYRELLWLYEVAQDPVYRSSEPPVLQRLAQEETQEVDIPLPWLQSQELFDQESLAPFDRVEPTPDSALMGIDLDLSAPWNPQRENVGRGGMAPSAPARLADTSTDDLFDAATGREVRRKTFHR